MVGVGVGLGFASVGVGVRGAGVTDGDGDELGDAEGDGLADGDATCCEAITAAPSSSSATSATAAKTVKTVDQRSTCRRPGGWAGGGATFTPSGGRSSCAVASGSGGGGFSCMRHKTARAVPNGRTLDRSAAGLMQDVRELGPEDGKGDDQDDREECHANEIVDEVLVSLHVV